VEPVYLGRCPRLVCVAPLGLDAEHRSWESAVLRREVAWRALPSSLSDAYPDFNQGEQ
jgi:hypothetical protein